MVRLTQGSSCVRRMVRVVVGLLLLLSSSSILVSSVASTSTLYLSSSANGCTRMGTASSPFFGWGIGVVETCPTYNYTGRILPSPPASVLPIAIGLSFSTIDAREGRVYEIESMSDGTGAIVSAPLLTRASSTRVILPKDSIVFAMTAMTTATTTTSSLLLLTRPAIALRQFQPATGTLTTLLTTQEMTSVYKIGRIVVGILTLHPQGREAYWLGLASNETDSTRLRLYTYSIQLRTVTSMSVEQLAQPIGMHYSSTLGGLIIVCASSVRFITVPTSGMVGVTTTQQARIITFDDGITHDTLTYTSLIPNLVSLSLSSSWIDLSSTLLIGLKLNTSYGIGEFTLSPSSASLSGVACTNLTVQSSTTLPILLHGGIVSMRLTSGVVGCNSSTTRILIQGTGFAQPLVQQSILCHTNAIYANRSSVAAEVVLSGRVLFNGTTESYVECLLPPSALPNTTNAIRVTLTGVDGRVTSLSPLTLSLTSLCTSSSVTVLKSSADIITLVSPPVTVSSTSPDPCTLRPGFCFNGGQCVSTQINSTIDTRTIQLSCTCPTAFFGPHCEVAILACTGGCSSPMGGNRTLQLYGIGFGYISSLLLSTLNLAFVTSSPLSTSDSRVLNEIRTISRGGVWEDRLLIDRKEIEVISFTTISYQMIVDAKATTTSTTTAMVDTTYQFVPMRFDLADLPAPSYQTLVAHAQFTIDSSTDILEVPYTLPPVYYAVSECVAGEFQNVIGDCIDCPDGCACPGQGRCWPLPGYWSYSQSSTPIKCPIADSCPGVVASREIPTVLATTATDTTSTLDTQICAEGYTGAGCVTCADSYYQLNQRCYSCGASTDQHAEMASILIVACGVTLGLAFSVAVFDAVLLVDIVTVLLIIQQFAQTGAEGAKSIDGNAGKGLATFFSYLTTVNFDLEILKPGCTVPTFTFLTLFWGTMALIALSGILFLIACLIRLSFKYGRPSLTPAAALALSQLALVEARKDLRQAAQTGRLFHTRPLEDFKQRLTHSLLILGSIFYLKSTMLMIRTFQCVTASDPQSLYAAMPGSESLYLKADLQTRCYEGLHLGTSIFVGILFGCYTFGFPLFTFILLVRAFADEKTDGITGWIYRHFAIMRRGGATPSKGKTMTMTTPTVVNMWDTNQPTVVYKDLTLDREKGEGEGGVTSLSGTNDSSTSYSAADKYAAPKPPPCSSADASLLARLSLERHRVALYGYLFLEVRHETFAFRVGLFVSTFYFACITVLVEESILRLFLLAIGFAVESLIVCWHLPFIKWYYNTQRGLTSILSLGHAVIMIGIQTNAIREPMFWIGLVIFLLMCLLLVGRNWFVKQLQRIFGSHVIIPILNQDEIQSDKDLKQGEKVVALTEDHTLRTGDELCQQQDQEDHHAQTNLKKVHVHSSRDFDSDRRPYESPLSPSHAVRIDLASLPRVDELPSPSMAVPNTACIDGAAPAKDESGTSDREPNHERRSSGSKREDSTNSNSASSASSARNTSASVVVVHPDPLSPLPPLSNVATGGKPVWTASSRTALSGSSPVSLPDRLRLLPHSASGSTLAPIRSSRALPPILHVVSGTPIVQPDGDQGTGAAGRVTETPTGEAHGPTPPAPSNTGTNASDEQQSARLRHTRQHTESALASDDTLLISVDRPPSSGADHRPSTVHSSPRSVRLAPLVVQPGVPIDSSSDDSDRPSRQNERAESD